MAATGRIDTMRMKAILVLAASVGFATAPFWSSGFGGFDPEAFPVPQIDPPVQPAGYAFSIWGVIYVWLVVSAGFGLLRRADDTEWDFVRWPLFLSLAIGTPWISVAMLSPLWATVLILLMLLTALRAFLGTVEKDRWLLRAPLGLYAGWLTAASFVSVGLVGAGYGVGFGETLWAWLAILGALVTGLWILRKQPVPTYGLALAWALVAIAVRNWNENWGLVAFTLLGAAAAAGYALRPR